MSNRIFISNEHSTENVAIGEISDFVERVLQIVEKDFWEVSIVFCDDAFIANLNETYRKVAGPTDVLSFEQGESYCDEADGKQWFCAGDIIISLDTLAKNSRDFLVPVEEELQRLLIHGILHLDGMDHQDNCASQPMLVQQEQILGAAQRKKNIPVGE